MRPLAVPLFAALLLPVPQPAESQTRQQVTAESVAQLLRTKGHAGYAIGTLRQEWGPVDQTTLTAIADSLTEIAIHFPGNTTRAASTRSNAAQTLLLSGKEGRGIAFAGAAKRLLRIALEANNGGALWSLTQLPDRQQSLRMLREVAVSDHRLAYAAVGHLGRDMGPEGVAVARELHVRDLVREPYAVRELASLAAHFKWPR